MRSIYWVREDLRLRDNHTLQHFCNESNEGLLLWAPTPSYLRAESFRKRYIDATLSHFSSSIRSFGLELQIGIEPIATELLKIIKEHKIQRIYFTKAFASEEMRDEKKVIELGNAEHIEIHSFDQSTLTPESQLPFHLEEMPFVFTEFRKKIEASISVKNPIPIPGKFPKSFLTNPIANLSQPTQLIHPWLACGEDEALHRLKNYFWENQSIKSYKETRNGMLTQNDSTKFSPLINQGALSARQIYSEIEKYENEIAQNDSTYWLKFELLWRDYFKFLSRRLKEKMFLNEDGHFKQVSVHPQAELNFTLWKAGKTEDQFINANMNELRCTGWMSNRGRQNVASYLIHYLQVPWTWGASYFEEMLIDYDPDLNWGNWLYLSGQGTDPRSRVFNPSKQAEMYDSNHLYRNKWSNKAQ